MEEVGKSVEKEFPSFKLEYKSIFPTSCKFDWKFKDKGYFKSNGDVTFHFYNHRTTELAQDSIQRFIEAVETEAKYTRTKYTSPKHIKDEFWDDFFLYQTTKDESGTLLLRKAGFVFRILSKNTDINLAIEEIVKTVKLN